MTENRSDIEQGAAPRIAVPQLMRRWWNRALPYAASAIFVAIAGVVSKLSIGVAESSALTLVFLIAVVVSANRFGLWPAVLSSFLSVLCWDYFFTQPYYSLRLDDPRDVFALIAFLSVSLVVSGMAEQIRRQRESVAALARSVTASYQLSQNLSRLATVEEIAVFMTAQFAELFSCRVVIVLVDHSDGHGWLVFPSDAQLTSDERDAAKATLYPLAIAPPSGRSGAQTMRFAPIEGARGKLGVVGLDGAARPPLSSDEQEGFDAFVRQSAIAIERAWLTRDVEHTRMVAETERIRNALLTSVSHDLRTPLTTIIGALSTLNTAGDVFSREIRTKLVATARKEALRLNRFVGNLLDITRLESGALAVTPVPVDLEEVVESALERAGELVSHHALDVAFGADLPEILADPFLLEQVIFNLLDNAAKYSPPGSTIAIRAAGEATACR